MKSTIICCIRYTYLIAAYFYTKIIIVPSCGKNSIIPITFFTSYKCRCISARCCTEIYLYPTIIYQFYTCVIGTWFIGHKPYCLHLLSLRMIYTIARKSTRHKCTATSTAFRSTCLDSLIINILWVNNSTGQTIISFAWGYHYKTIIISFSHRWCYPFVFEITRATFCLNIYLNMIITVLLSICSILGNIYGF